MLYRTKMKQRIPRSLLIKRIGRNPFPNRKITLRHQRMLSQRANFISLQKLSQSNFALQLQAKQKIAAFYGALPAGFLRSVFQQTAQKGARQIEAGEGLFMMLESRLDVVLLRAGWVLTLAQARQMIAHGGVSINDNLVSCPSYMLEPGDLIEFTKNSFHVTLPYAHIIENTFNFSHLEINLKTRSIVFLYYPQYIQWPLQVDFGLFARYFQRF